MGLVSAILMIVGTLIGTGIFASPGPLFDSVHCTQTSFIIWAFAGIVCTIGAFAYAELGTMFPASGDAMPWLVRGFSIGAIILMGLINIFFKEGGKYASNVLAVFKVAGMCMLIVIGSMQAVKNHAQSEALQIPIRESSQNVLDYVSALCFAFFAYNGFNNINLGLGELRDPERNLKRAVFIAMPFVTILFLLANFAFFSILSSYDLRHVHSLSLHAGHTVLGQPGGFLMAGTVVASALGSINASLWAGSRLLVIMAKDNTVIPFPVARIWSRTGTQAIAILILAGQASFHSLINLDFKTFSKIYSAVGWTWYGLSVAGLLYLRKTRPNHPRPVKVFWPLAAFFVVIAAVLVVGSLTLAFMSSAIQNATTGEGGDDEENDVATGGGADGSGDGGGKYVSIIMFGMVILFMMGVIPAFYLTKRYNQEHGLKTAGSSGSPSTVESDTESSEEDKHDDHGEERLRRGSDARAGAGAGGEMVQVNRSGPLHPYQYHHQGHHQTAITIDIDLPPTTVIANTNTHIHNGYDFASLT
ncbi:hypothetical protein BGX24_000255, partial [Mortierella sp. AD032]